MWSHAWVSLIVQHRLLSYTIYLSCVNKLSVASRKWLILRMLIGFSTNWPWLITKIIDTSLYWIWAVTTKAQRYYQYIKYTSNRAKHHESFTFHADSCRAPVFNSGYALWRPWWTEKSQQWYSALPTSSIYEWYIFASFFFSNRFVSDLIQYSIQQLAT